MTGNTPGGKLITRQLGSSFVAFAKTGNPNNREIPGWEPYNASQRAVMIFGEKTHSERDPNSEIRQMWNKILSA